MQSANNANSDDENEISDLNDPDYYCDDHPSKDEGTSEQDTYDGGGKFNLYIKSMNKCLISKTKLFIKTCLFVKNLMCIF